MSLRPIEGKRVLVTLPYPPLLNHMYIKTARGVFLSSETTGFRLQVCNAVSRQTQGEYFEADQQLIVSLDVYRPAKRGDIDATPKAVLDALNGVLWHDDKQIVELHIYRHDDKHNPRIELVVSSIASKSPIPRKKRARPASVGYGSTLSASETLKSEVSEE